MRATVFRTVGQPPDMEERPLPLPGVGEIGVRIEACAVCRTDLNIFDVDLPNPKMPLIPGHEIVGIAEEAEHASIRLAYGKGFIMRTEVPEVIGWIVAHRRTHFQPASVSNQIGLSRPA